ncbi:MAG: rhodanese-like domain-containing protein [Myxococcota bacterium]
MTRRSVVHITRLACAPIVFLAATACAQPQDGAPRISASELVQRIEAGSAPTILDVRTEVEFADGHIPGALNIPYDQLAARIAEIPGARSDEIAVHCHSGRRAGIAKATLRGAGFTRVRDLDGHWKAWAGAGLPSE